MVGLRWWNYIDEEGKSIWVYESRDKSQSNRRHSAREVRLFWMGLILVPAVWALFFLVALFGLKFKWLLLVAIALALNFANLHGYIKCNFGASKDMKSATTDFVRAQVFKNAVDLLSKNAQPPVVQPNNAGIV